MSSPPRAASLVSFKAFGDLVIAVEGLARRPGRSRDHIRILLGQHLVPLFDALAPDIPVDVLHHSEPSLPSLFTVKKDGIIKAAHSAMGLRRAMLATGIPKDRLLLFDRLGPRERLVTMGWARAVMSGKDNIYLSYDRLFEDLALDPPQDATPHASGGPLRIFPGSRVPAKNLPVHLVRDILRVGEARGLAVSVALLEGERPDLEDCGLPVVMIPRSFDAMAAAVRDAGRIVGADSMPAHIAEYVRRPSFVFSPVPNRYWLPRSAFLGGHDALFAEGAGSRALATFLDAV